MGFIVLAYYQKKAVAGAMYFQFGKKAIYKYGASERGYQHLRTNNAVIWEAIRWYSLNHFEEISFGRTDPKNKGLLQFKNGWGAKQDKIYYQKYDFPKSKFVEKKSTENPIFEKIFNHLPISALRLSGSLFYKHMG